jgi:chromate transporter
LGKPIALVGFMQHDLVEKRKWFSASEYRDGLALAQLAPGPLAAQVAMYLDAGNRARGAGVASRFRKVPEPLLILLAGLVGILLRRLG